MQCTDFEPGIPNRERELQPATAQRLCLTLMSPGDLCDLHRSGRWPIFAAKLGRLGHPSAEQDILLRPRGTGVIIGVDDGVLNETSVERTQRFQRNVTDSRDYSK